jgi:hypothetical protein
MNKQVKSIKPKNMTRKNKNACTAQISPRTVREYLMELYGNDIKDFIKNE